MPFRRLAAAPGERETRDRAEREQPHRPSGLPQHAVLPLMSNLTSDVIPTEGPRVTATLEFSGGGGHWPGVFLRAARESRRLARRRSEGDNWISHMEALALAYSGRLQQARNTSRRAVAEAQQAAQRERAAQWETAAALREAFFGNAYEARRRATAALNLSKNREVEYAAAFALALTGDDPRSEAVANDLERRFPEDTSIRFRDLPALRARLALNRGDVTKAFEQLQAAIPNELGVPRSRLEGGFGALYPIYVRGQAYLAAHQGTAATMEFQKIFDHTGIVVSDPVGAIARLQLGRAFALSGEKVRAKGAYTDFLTLWREADADIPILKQAKEEYTNLKD